MMTENKGKETSEGIKRDIERENEIEGIQFGLFSTLVQSKRWVLHGLAKAFGEPL